MERVLALLLKQFDESKLGLVKKGWATKAELIQIFCPPESHGLNSACFGSLNIAEAVMALPEKERLELARRIVASIVVDQDISGKIAQAQSS
jgi:hypothetical protein